MNDVLSMCRHLPRLQFRRGQPLIEESVHTDRLYILESGEFEVLREGVRVVRIGEAGAFLGEMAVLLGSAPTASVIATRDSSVYVIEQASAAVRAQPELTHAIATILARRLNAVTTYLVDIKHQYADSDTHLGLMDQVLSSLLAAHPAAHRPGSERDDVPDY